MEAAYPGRRFYYVLTHARGIPPPFKHALSLIAEVDDGGEVRRLDLATLADYRAGLRKVRSVQHGGSATA